MAGSGNPYANRLNIGVTLDKTSDGFLCEEITAVLTAAVAILAPELLEVDALEDVEFEAICGIIDDPLSALDGLQDAAKCLANCPGLYRAGVGRSEVSRKYVDRNRPQQPYNFQKILFEKSVLNQSWYERTNPTYQR